VFGSKLLRSVCTGLSLVALAAGCDDGTTKRARPRHSSPGDARGQPAAFTMPNGSFAVAQLPPGFSVWREPRHGNGPIPGTSFDAQDFVNVSGKQKFTVSVHRGTPASMWTAPDRPPNPMSSSRKVQGRDTYFIDMGISLQREVMWVVDATTLGYVIGNNVTDDELLSVAEAVHVSK
jgi:hypothetical protein